MWLRSWLSCGDACSILLQPPGLLACSSGGVYIAAANVPGLKTRGLTRWDEASWVLDGGANLIVLGREFWVCQIRLICLQDMILL